MEINYKDIAFTDYEQKEFIDKWIISSSKEMKDGVLILCLPLSISPMIYVKVDKQEIEFLKEKYNVSDFKITYVPSEKKELIKKTLQAVCYLSDEVLEMTVNSIVDILSRES